MKGSMLSKIFLMTIYVILINHFMKNKMMRLLENMNVDKRIILIKVTFIMFKLSKMMRNSSGKIEQEFNEVYLELLILIFMK